MDPPEGKTFLVQGTNDSYVVDMEVEFCSCRAGKAGKPCKHLAAVDKHFDFSSSLFLHVDGKKRAKLLKLAGGKPIFSEQLV